MQPFQLSPHPRPLSKMERGEALSPTVQITKAGTPARPAGGPLRPGEGPGLPAGQAGVRFLLASDKFKGSLTAQQVCDSIALTLQEQYPESLIEKFPMADGGEGTCDLLTSISGGSKIVVKARDPLFRSIETFYGLSPDGKTAFIEMASASGLQLLKQDERNPGLTSSVGTGDMIAHALTHGVKSIVLGCGGSGTNDAGIGMATALGFSFFGSDGKILQPIGENLSKIESIHSDEALKEISGCKFLLITDVDNPLFGPQGAAFTFAPQKGASPKDVEKLDQGMKHFAQILERYYHSGIIDFPGAGAGGGLPVSARAFLNAEIKPGIDFIIEFANLEEKIKRADWVITGEGKFDQQSLHGKVVSGMARLCRQYQKKLWVICGVSEVTERQAKQMGIEKVLTISSTVSGKEEAMRNADELLRKEIRKALEDF